MSDARARVDAQVAWMAGAGRPSPQRADEEDGASAEFVVNGTHVMVFAEHGLDTTELYAFEPGGRVRWEFTVAGGTMLDDAAREVVTTTLIEMGSQVRFPAPASRTRWRDTAGAETR